MTKKSVARIAIPIKALESVDGSKFIGRLLTKDGRMYHLIRGDKVVVVRRKKILVPK